jgi:Sulfotransferase family
MRGQSIERPIFVIGCGRSGTTVLYEALCAHPHVAWFSNYTERWPRTPQLALLSYLRRFQRICRSSSRFAPKPVEGYPLWNMCSARSEVAGNAPLVESDVFESESQCLKQLIADHLRYQHASRFVNKNTRNSRRIRYLRQIFPDAQFIHLLRDPRATAASLVRVSWWRDLPLWWADNQTPRRLTARGHTDAVLAANHWRFVVERLLADSQTLPASQYLEVRYEEFIDSPTQVLAQIVEFCGLPWSASFAKNVAERRLVSANTKFRSQFDTTELAAMSDVFGPLAKKLGYLVGDEALKDSRRRPAFS